MTNQLPSANKHFIKGIHKHTQQPYNCFFKFAHVFAYFKVMLWCGKIVPLVGKIVPCKKDVLLYIVNVDIVLECILSTGYTLLLHCTSIPDSGLGLHRNRSHVMCNITGSTWNYFKFSAFCFKNIQFYTHGMASFILIRLLFKLYL